MKKTILTLVILVFLLSGLMAFVEQHQIRINRIIIKDASIPQQFNNKKIAFISDIHCGPYFSIKRVRNLVEMINKLHPDIILLGGDYVYRNKANIYLCAKELKELKAPLGVIAVLGNHDYGQGPISIKNVLTEAGILIMDNTGKWINVDNSRIKIGGLADFWCSSPNITNILQETSEKDFVMVLSHNPDFSERITCNRVDLVLSGHTHGGQITCFGLWAPFTSSQYGQKYRSGVVQTPHTKVVITNGIGTTGMPLRFFAPPSIELLTLNH
ncbi:MAG TPA: metallophosphoesterase [Candidatus Margulisbacteria bacterium]|nr:MAG: hypothetical protein A2X43_10270 [Candidatus Margulisbacteria bacterium GWD2_39_127]OGI05435.1 MAG: hypothetical protein A2X42_09240 [Candidatus Margulisbacteria bacterium GWF2_38_17]OGI07827.1 MAG: hypothetical protein A2X41_11915 [Candidatus Margulisbacteria bacterium GWE2_39_32]HAR62618.1 metallophosphoesterase [Candidatus Margulisiibacteriota bacterium]HCT84344.1 metallophosphoesterase [Candidatus Margulisiibacteriota bacterium]